MNSFYQLLAKQLLLMHNILYRLISVTALKAEGGLHPKHRLMNYHQFFLDHISEDDRILDIGCGNGALACDLAKKAKSVVGMDLNPKHQITWRGRYAAPNLLYRIGDASVLPVNETFDILVLSNVLEHVEKRTDFLERIKHLAPTLLIRVPMINRDWITLYKKEMEIESRLDKTHFTEYTLETFQHELSSAGFSLETFSIQFGEIWAVVKTHV